MLISYYCLVCFLHSPPSFFIRTLQIKSILIYVKISTCRNRDSIISLSFKKYNTKIKKIIHFFKRFHICMTFLFTIISINNSLYFLPLIPTNVELLIYILNSTYLILSYIYCIRFSNLVILFFILEIST